MDFHFSNSPKVVNIPEPIIPYLQDMDKLLKKFIGFENIYSIVLFGSYARKDYSKNSDIDLLIILKNEFYDSLSKEFLHQFERLALGVEAKHGLKLPNAGFITAMLNVIEKTTGMFVSHFMCKKEDWDRQIFHKIFNVNKFMSKLLAPGQIVLKNMSQSYIVLFGANMEPRYKEHIGIIQLMKSLVMTELISIGSIIIFPLWKNVIKYCLESFKWTVRNSYLFLFNKHASIESIRYFFTKNAVSVHYFDKFLKLRKEFRQDYKFALRCPFETMKVYMTAIRYRKMVGNGNTKK